MPPRKLTALLLLLTFGLSVGELAMGSLLDDSGAQEQAVSATHASAATHQSAPSTRTGSPNGESHHHSPDGHDRGAAHCVHAHSPATATETQPTSMSDPAVSLIRLTSGQISPESLSLPVDPRPPRA